MASLFGEARNTVIVSSCNDLADKFGFLDKSLLSLPLGQGQQRSRSAATKNASGPKLAGGKIDRGWTIG